VRKFGLIFLIVLAVSFPAYGKKKKPTSQPTTQDSAAADAAYTKTLEARVAPMVAALNIDDPDKAKRIHDLIVNQYRALNQWQTADNAPDADKAAMMAQRQQLHDKFKAALAADLTPAQIETVEDKMTVNKVKVTYDNYLVIVPNLSDEDRAMILKLLKDAREEAIDGVNMDEKSAIFKKYKGKIANYLDAHGHDVAQAYKDWGAGQKARQGGAATTAPAMN
jgi:hypothetical protein